MTSNLQGTFMKRLKFLTQIDEQLQAHPICAILGPRQVGKTTLANQFAQNKHFEDVAIFDLENPEDVARLDNAMLALGASDLTIIDEIQRRPELFPILRVIVDRTKRKQKFLILGSASRDLIKQSSETLAGRIGYIEITPFSIQETQADSLVWLRGGFPESYLATSSKNSMTWRKNYITTFVERDIPALGFNIPALQLRRFWMMLAHCHGQIFNASDLAKSLMISGHTVRRYLDILAGTFMIRVLQPWFENISKRQVKSPKIYFRDSGILHTMLNIETEAQLQNHPKLGSLWEGMALEEVIRTFDDTLNEWFFWATQANAELDLLLLRGGKRIGFEFKYTDAPKITKSMRIALQDLKLDHLFVIYPGENKFPMADKITAYGLEAIVKIEFNTLIG
jgi:predicted AAA+ superfamily ATPase